MNAGVWKVRESNGRSRGHLVDDCRDVGCFHRKSRLAFAEFCSSELWTVLFPQRDFSNRPFIQGSTTSIEHQKSLERDFKW